MKQPSYVTRLDTGCKSIYRTPARAFFDALYIAMVRYNLKHGKKQLSKRHMCRYVYPTVPEWYKKSFYSIYELNLKIKTCDLEIERLKERIETLKEKK